MKARLTPQQKKQLSYARDRRNAYGERGANSRFAISANKLHERRKLRRVADAAVQTLGGSADETELLQAESAARVGQAQPAHFVKCADVPLCDSVEYKLQRRAMHREVAAQALAEDAGRRLLLSPPMGFSADRGGFTAGARTLAQYAASDQTGAGQWVHGAMARSTTIRRETGSIPSKRLKISK